MIDISGVDAFHQDGENRGGMAWILDGSHARLGGRGAPAVGRAIW